MRGLTFQGNGNVAVADVAEPTMLAPTDAIVQITMAGICGSDLHILNAGEAFGFAPGARLGHEFLGTVAEVGADVRGFAPGRPGAWWPSGSAAATASGARRDIRASCEQVSIFGWAPRLWRHGGAVEGGQSEYARVPLAETTLIKIPDAVAASRARDQAPADHRRDGRPRCTVWSPGACTPATTSW